MPQSWPGGCGSRPREHLLLPGDAERSSASRRHLAGGGRGSQHFHIELWIACTPAPLLLASPCFCSVFPTSVRVTALIEREGKDDFLPHPSYIGLSFGNSVWCQWRGKAAAPSVCQRSTRLHHGYPWCKEIGLCLCYQKKVHFAMRSAMCVCHLTGKPPQRAKLCSSYCDVPTWSDVGCHGPQQLTSLWRRFQPQQLMVLKQMCYRLFYDFCTKQKKALQQPELGRSLFFSKAV